MKNIDANTFCILSTSPKTPKKKVLDYGTMFWAR
jgi:hypothetical protein